MRRSLLAKETITGFTLAEVLITLTIIGVIAALTIPSLIQNIQDQQYKTALKEVYSELTQAASKLSMDNGGTIKGLCPTGSSDEQGDCVRNAFVNYMSYNKICVSHTSLGNCWPANYKRMDNVDDNTGNWGAGVILNNGVSLMFSWSGSACNANVGSPPIYQACGWVFADVNGIKPPNTWGKDIFRFNIVENGIKPGGIPGDGLDGTCNITSNGLGCAAVYLKGQTTN